MVAKKKTIKKTTRSTKKSVRRKPVKNKVSKKAVKKKAVKKTVKKAKVKKRKKIKLSRKLPIISQAAVTKTKGKRIIRNELAEKYYAKYKIALEEVYGYFEQEMDARQNGDTRRRKNMKEQGYRAQERADEAYGKFLKAKERDEE